MKKTLSIILALIMALSMAVPAFAADTKINLGKKVTVSLDADDEKALFFNVPDDGIYKLSFALSGGNEAYADIYFYDEYFGGTYLCNEDENRSDELVLFAAEDDEITIELYTIEYSSKVSVTVEEYNCSELKMGKSTISADEIDMYYTFTPAEDGYYNFKSVCDSSKADPYIAVCEDDGSLIGENDDNGRCEDEYCDFNFDLTVYLYEDETYYINLYNRTDENGNYNSYDVVVSYNIKEELEEFAVYGSYGETELIELSRNYEDYLTISAVPTGALPTADVSITSSDENVVSISEYDETTGIVYFYSNNAGTATITVEINGVTQQIDVKVYSDFAVFVMNLFSGIRNFFMSIFYSIFGGLLGGYDF